MVFYDDVDLHLSIPAQMAEIGSYTKEVTGCQLNKAGFTVYSAYKKLALVYGYGYVYIYMCVYIYVCIFYVCIYICIYSIYICIYLFIHSFIHSFIYLCIYL